MKTVNLSIGQGSTEKVSDMEKAFAVFLAPILHQSS